MISGSFNVFIKLKTFMTKSNTAILTEEFNLVILWSGLQNNKLFKLNKLLNTFRLKRVVDLKQTPASSLLRADRY